MNKELIKNSLDEITLETFKEALTLAMLGEITNMAPLGFSGDDIEIFGNSHDENGIYTGRESLIQVRNYNNSPQLLITDKKGAFLFYGTFYLSLGIDFIANEFYSIFCKIKHKIEIEVPRAELDSFVTEKTTYSEGFNILEAYIEKLNNKKG